MKPIGLVVIMSLALSACNAQDDSRTHRMEIPFDRLADEDMRERGRALFLNKCALCHGDRADGRGLRREGLSKRPTNFRSKDWRANADPLDVYTVVTEGKRGTSMPAWPTLGNEQRWALVAYLLGVSEESP